MKITPILLLLSSLAFSQQFKKLDSVNFKNQVDNLLNITGKTFKFYKFTKQNDVKILSYKAIDSEDKISVFYYTYREGKDTNLKANGVESWDFKSVASNYLNIFPIWVKYADPSTSKEKLSQKKYMSTDKFTISELETDYWMLRF